MKDVTKLICLRAVVTNHASNVNFGWQTVSNALIKRLVLYVNLIGFCDFQTESKSILRGLGFRV